MSFEGCRSPSCPAAEESFLISVGQDAVFSYQSLGFLIMGDLFVVG